MIKIGEFIYPWGGGHYSRMMRLNAVLGQYIDNYDIHYASKGHIYEKLQKRFPDALDKIHKVLMPTPIDGKFGPSITLSMMNILVPIENNPSLVNQIVNYLREERVLYDKYKFDLVINDGDMGSNILANNRNIPSLFITNQFRPKMYSTRAYLYPSAVFIAKQIGKATKILVADSPPPYTICKYNLNFPDNIKDKVVYVGCFIESVGKSKVKTDLEKLIRGKEFGYWMRTGNKSTNNGTGERYEKIFADQRMKNECRIVSHARDDPNIERVIGRDSKTYTISDALDKKIDWLQIDIGFLSEKEKNSVINGSKYSVINGSHTVMGEIMGGKAKPIIGIPIYDEHTNNIKWADEHGLGMIARNTNAVIDAIFEIKTNYESFEERLEDFARNFVSSGAINSAKIVAETLKEKR